MTQSLIPKPGSIVSCRDRQWVVIPSETEELIRLRPLSGNEDEIAGVYGGLGLETIKSANFPLPLASEIRDHKAAMLLMDAARLLLRSGAGPFRCLGRLSLRPRPYQLVPLLMALRLEMVRLLIADDVGIGKTIEAGLIARELLDRGEIKRMAVLCPPHLCDQWQQELQEKFHIDAVVVRSGTVSKLERGLPADVSIFSYYRHLIVSLDYAKSERRLASFVTHCPELVIVDEAHTCTRLNVKGKSQQQRHYLIQEIAKRKEQHLLLLTATPHSGIEESFLSLLGLLKPEFGQFKLDSLTDGQKNELVRHFIQRRRADVKIWLGKETPFPQRESEELAYKLSKEYKQLFEDVYDFARGLVKTTTEEMSYAQRRGRYWSALALIRCVMSSPAAAEATLIKQIGNHNFTSNIDNSITDLDEELMSSYVYDSTEEDKVVDASPSVVVSSGALAQSQSRNNVLKRNYKRFVEAARSVGGSKDKKLQSCIKQVQGLLEEGYNPILWCRYIATANYVADALKQKLEKKGSKVRVIGITGELSDDEREIRLEELKSYDKRILVATDCLSEGVNLQSHFNAVIHYDLPWNPNRLEQREGRVDRYGQSASKVKTCLLYGQDNPVDGAVLEVLIRKAVQIHKTLGITVPVPMDSNTVSEAVFKSLFDRATDAIQLSLLDLLDEESTVETVHKNWDKAVEKEKISRTRFAQRAIKPEEVQEELIESDRILGSEADVERFVESACERLSISLIKKKKGWLLQKPPDFLKPVLGNTSRLLAFTTPVAEGVEYIGRNHPLVEGLARHILENSLENDFNPIAARCGFVTTDNVEKRTTLLLVRLRHLLNGVKCKYELLAEECMVIGFTGSPLNPVWLEQEKANSLLQTVNPVGDAPKAIKKGEIEELLERLDDLKSDLENFAQQRSHELAQSHRRVRAITKEGAIHVKPQLPMDILGVYILQPGKRKT